MIKKFAHNPNLSWEENYRALEKHHIEETTELYDKIKKLKLSEGMRSAEDFGVKWEVPFDPDPGSD